MVHVVLVPRVHCCNKVVLNRPCCVFASWLFSAKLVYKILQRHFDFHARLTKQNFSSETTQASQSCNKKKKTITCRISSK